MNIIEGDYMKLIVGLGNPGKEYEFTRHNMGFFVVDNYLKKKYGVVSWKNKFDGLYYETILNGDKVIFLKPQLYMNLSGEVIKKFVDYFNVEICDILVISDDLDLSPGNFKLKTDGSSGGHNGLKNIELCIGSSCYKRLKIGISKSDNIDTKDYVLGRISKDDLGIYNEELDILINVIDDYLNIPFSDLMCKYNKKNR